MPLIDASTDGWKLNRINIGPPYHVEAITYGPQYGRLAGKSGHPQVCDRLGIVAVSCDGAVFCANQEQADAICAAANAGLLETI